MKLTLRKLESEAPEGLLAAAEALLDHEGVQGLTEVEPNLWTAQADGYEIEVQANSRRATAATCECDLYQEQGLCEHIIAALLYLRARQQEAQEAKKQNEARPSAPTRLTTGTVLDHASHEELASFVRDYARSNRNFAIALKARFASAVPDMRSEDKYLQVLQTTLSAVRKPDRRITVRGAQRLLKVLNELQAQGQLALSQKAFLDALHISQAIITEISPAIGKTKGRQKELLAAVRDAFQQLQALLGAAPSPSIVRQIWSFARAEHAKRLYRSFELDTSFLQLMLETAQGAEDHEDISGLLTAQQSRYEEAGLNPAPLLLLQVTALEKQGKETAARQLMEQNLAQPDVIAYAVRQARSKQQWPRVKALAQTGLRLSLPPGTQSWLYQQLLELAQQEGDKKSLYTYARLRFLDTLQPELFQLMKKASSKTEWPQRFETTLAHLQQKAYSPALRDAIAFCLAEEGAWPVLMHYATEVQSLDLLEAYSAPLRAHFPEEAAQLFRALINEYAKHHLGRKTAQRIRQALAHLMAVGEKALALDIRKELLEAFGERHALAEELALLSD